MGPHMNAVEVKDGIVVAAGLALGATTHYNLDTYRASHLAAQRQFLRTLMDKLGLKSGYTPSLPLDFA